MKLLITTRADANIKTMTDISHPIIKKYAEDIGADFMVLDHVSDCKIGDGRWHFRIMKHYDLFEEYDRIMHLDSDMILNKNCPNLFDVVPYEEVGTIYEDKGTRIPARRNCMISAQKKFGDIGWTQGYINTGVFVTSKCHKNIFTKINEEYYTDWGSDDVHIGYQIKKQGISVYELPFQFNHMTMFSQKWSGFANRFDSYILHYAGKGVFDDGVKSRIEQMEKDLEKIYG